MQRKDAIKGITFSGIATFAVASTAHNADGDCASSRDMTYDGGRLVRIKECRRLKHFDGIL